MAMNRLTWVGLDELKNDLRLLPVALGGEGGKIAEGHANGAAATIKAGYPARTGNLRDKVVVVHTRGAFGAKSIVKNTSKHARVFESGSQARHTELGANRGAMPPNPIFTQTVMRARRAMYADLIALMERHGLTVTGSM
jgi:hypothetical protein